MELGSRPKRHCICASKFDRCLGKTYLYGENIGLVPLNEQLVRFFDPYLGTAEYGIMNIMGMDQLRKSIRIHQSGSTYRWNNIMAVHHFHWMDKMFVQVIDVLCHSKSGIRTFKGLVDHQRFTTRLIGDDLSIKLTWNLN